MARQKKYSTKDVEKLGYEVGEAFTNEDGTVYRVEGFGISIMINDDQETWKALVASHDSRVSQLEE